MDYNYLSDKILVDNIRSGEKEAHKAFKELHKRWLNKVYGRALRLLYSTHDAEEITQEVFLMFYRTVMKGSVKGEDPGHYVMRMTTNMCYNHIKRNKIGKRALEEVQMAGKESNGAKREKNIVGDIVNDAVNSLPFQLKVLVVQRYFERRSIKEIAEETKRSIRGINYLLQQARRILAHELKSAGVMMELL